MNTTSLFQIAGIRNTLLGSVLFCMSASVATAGNAGKNILYTMQPHPVVSKNYQTPEKTITGTVTDAAGELMIGVTVVVDGTTTGTVTDINGKFTIKVPENSVLNFSFMGYRQQSVNVANISAPLVITMEEFSHITNEVVVTALGIKREKKLLGYSIQELKSDELNETGAPVVTEALQGKVAGLQMNISPTGLNGSTKITIRGNSSLTDNNQPLWIIDGVPFNDNSNEGASVYGGYDRGGVSADINPEDIESISVLKGPNAAALYGSRAGNGVILITTKKGTGKEGFGVNYSNNFTWTQVTEALYMQDKYGQGMNGVQSAGALSYGALLDGHSYTSWNGETREYRRYGNNIKDYFNTGFSQSHNVSIGKNTETSDYRFSFGSMDSKGIFDNEALNRLNLDIKAGMKMNSYLSMDSKVSLSRTKASGRPYNGKYGEMYQLLTIPNNIMLNDLKQYSTDEQVHANWFGPSIEIMNPYYVNHQRPNIDERWRAFGYHSFRIDFAKWLYGTAKYAFDYYRTGIEEKDYTNGINKTTDTVHESYNYTTFEDNFYEHNMEFFLFGKHTLMPKMDVGYSIGGNRMYQKSDRQQGMSTGMPNADKGYWSHNMATVFNGAQESHFQRATNSVFGTFQFVYDNYFALDVTGRNDWSSTLPIKNCSYFYPSVNLSFVLSDFLNRNEPTTPSWLTFAKLRLSFAEVGKDTEPYKLMSYYTYSQTSGGLQITQPKIEANSNLMPEKARAYEAGLDIRFFNNRLGFDFTYYQNLTLNQIMVLQTSGTSSGYEGSYVNAGEITNEGFELMINSTPVSAGDFTFDLGVNLAHNVSKAKKLHESAKTMSFNFAGHEMIADVRATEGKKLGEIWGELNYMRDAQGQIVVNRITGIPVVLTRQKSQGPIGNIQPDLLMSVLPALSYKNVSLTALFDAQIGGDIISASESYATLQGTAKKTENREDILVAGVYLDGDGNSVPNTQTISAQSYYTNIARIAEEFLYDASFIRLKELSLSYRLPKRILDKTPLTSFRISLVGRNLCYLFKNTPGTSPQGGFDTTMFSQAFDYAAVPYTKTFGFSVNLGF